MEKKLANTDELTIAATEWLAERCKKDADITWVVKQLVNVCEAVQADRDVFMVNVDQGHFALVYVTENYKVDQLFASEDTYKALGFEKSRSKQTLPWTLKRNMGIIGDQLQGAINRILKASGSEAKLPQITKAAF